jgi:hypothetical protein
LNERFYFFIIFILILKMTRAKNDPKLSKHSVPKVSKLSERSQPPKRNAAIIAASAIQDISEWLQDTTFNIFTKAMPRQDDKPYIDAVAKHQQMIDPHVDKSGKRGGHIRKGTGGSYDHQFNGKTQAVKFKVEEDRAIGLFRIGEGEEGDEEESVPPKWRRLKPKYFLK